MNQRYCCQSPWLTLFVFVASGCLALASSVLRLSTPELVGTSDAVCRGMVVQLTPFKGSDGLIYTRALVRVSETFKGTFSDVVMLVHRGGELGSEGELFGWSPRFQLGNEYLLFLSLGAERRLQSLQGAASAFNLKDASEDAVERLAEVRAMAAAGVIPGADVTDQAGPSGPYSAALTGMLHNLNSRFLQPDRGEPIPYLVDATVLPTGVTLQQATNAVRQALDAWAAVSSLQFRFEGLQDFGTGADAVNADDGRLRIQLHDSYGRISGSGVLGIGGRSSASRLAGTWDLGGNVNGTEFRLSTEGYVVLKHTHVSMQNVATMAEVLCHEIGHALNLAHSSEVVTSDPVLQGAIMYFQAHADGRGATLGAYDPPIIRQIYPTNTPPFTFERVLDSITASQTINVSGINEVDFVGYDLQSASLTLATNLATTNNGIFTLSGTRIRYAPKAAYSDSGRLDVSDGSYYDIIYARYSDGTNASPYGQVRVVSYSLDSHNPPDGLPNTWMQTYFGHTDPRSADRTRSTNDFDFDGVSNINEFFAGTNPANSNSFPSISSIQPGVLQFNARPYELYQIVGSTNLTNWARVGWPFVPTNGTLSELTAMPQVAVTSTISNVPMNEPHQFFRMRKMP